MSDQDFLADQFEAHRRHLHGVAYRMLGSTAEADDAVQEAWLRLSRSDTSEVQNLGGWLTTVVARVSLDMLRSRSSRREDPDEPSFDEYENGTDPEDAVLLADSIGLALLVVLDTLSPAERVAFVLHDTFGLPFEEIAPILGRSPAATRQLASRARRRVQGASNAAGGDPGRQHEVVEAFLAASRQGDLQGLIALLDPSVVARADAAAIQTGADPEVVGAAAVAETFSGRAKAAQLALIDGATGLVWSYQGVPKVVFRFTVTDGAITGIDLLADEADLARMDLVLLDR